VKQPDVPISRLDRRARIMQAASDVRAALIRGWNSPAGKRVRAFRLSATLALALFSALLTLLTLRLSSATANWSTAFQFLSHPVLFLLNWLPVLGWLMFWFYVLGRPWAAFVLTAAPVLGLACVNYYKLLLRGDPLLAADLQLAEEAKAISGRYSFTLSAGIVFAVLLAVGAGALLWFQYRHTPRQRLPRRALGCAACAALLMGFAGLALTSDTLYAKTGLACSWLPTQSYTSHGMLYPFLRSVRDAASTPPDGYDEAAAQATLAAYTDADIPDERRVDVIAVMLEAYNDFSTFGVLDFDTDPYADLHALEAESYHGQLVTNIFGGETVNTERAFLTGYLDPSDTFRAPVNSFVWYLRGQGYACVGDHPGYGWFYNRMNVNTYLGFEQYHFYEDRYRTLAGKGGITRDADFLPTIVQDYRAAREDGRNVFSFNVSYQNHGPYSTEPAYDQAYLPWQEGLDEADYNIANNYFTGIAETGRQLTRLVDAFREEARPVVVVIFGDHNPWWGDDNSAYHTFGINIDRATEEGFYNYYCTPYLIWANDAAKETLGTALVGEGGRIAPSLLMTRLFTLAGWDGPAYMQLLRTLEAHTPFVNRARYLTDGVLTGVAGSGEQGSDEPAWLTTFRQAEYYEKHSTVPADTLAETTAAR